MEARTDAGDDNNNDNVSTALKAEEKLKSHWYVLEPGGSLVPAQELIEEIKAQTKDRPYLPLNLPRRISKRPQIMV
ncbi:MAG: hypothetical protein ABI348_00565 [Nitrososphaera sp.]